MPSEFKAMIAYARNLEFKEEPNYDFLRSLLYNVASREDITLDYCYDWMQPLPEEPVLPVTPKKAARASMSSMVPMHSNAGGSVNGPMSPTTGSTPVSRRVSRARVSDFPPLIEGVQFNVTSAVL
jgi:hypothetical protein